MSGFLTNVLARSFGQLETIRPHVPSLFEPLAAGSIPVTPAGFGAAESEESVESDAAVTTAGRSIARLDEQAAIRTMNITGAEGHDRVAQATRQDTVRKADDVAVESLSPPTHLVPHEVHRSIGLHALNLENIPRASAPLPRESSSPNLQPGVEGTAFAEGTSCRNEIDRSTAPPPLTGETNIVTVTRVSASRARYDSDVNLQQAVNLEERDSSSRSIGAPCLGNWYSPPALLVRTPSSLETIRARQQKLRPQFDQRRSLLGLAEPEPTIQVTIGRIEVRAESSSSPSKERPPPKPMSLDEYLRRRTGRGR
jgi:hypothetical protein